MITISFYPKYLEENIDKDLTTAKYRAWLEEYGNYGRLFMWDIGRINPGDNSEIIGVRIFEDELGTLFRLTFDV